jgi:hypothetical protein
MPGAPSSQPSSQRANRKTGSFTAGATVPARDDKNDFVGEEFTPVHQVPHTSERAPAPGPLSVPRADPTPPGSPRRDHDRHISIFPKKLKDRSCCNRLRVRIYPYLCEGSSPPVAPMGSPTEGEPFHAPCNTKPWRGLTEPGWCGGKTRALEAGRVPEAELARHGSSPYFEPIFNPHYARGAVARSWRWPCHPATAGART